MLPQSIAPNPAARIAPTMMTELMAFVTFISGVCSARVSGACQHDVIPTKMASTENHQVRDRGIDRDSVHSSVPLSPDQRAVDADERGRNDLVNGPSSMHRFWDRRKGREIRQGCRRKRARHRAASVAGRFQGATICKPLSTNDAPVLDEQRAVATLTYYPRSTITSRLHALDVIFRQERGCRPSRNERGGDDDVRGVGAFRRSARTAGVCSHRSSRGIALALRLCPAFFVQERDLDKFAPNDSTCSAARFRAHVEGLDHRPEPLRGSDRLKARDAGAEHERVPPSRCRPRSSAS